MTQLLDAYGRGDAGAFDQLVTLVYQDLRRIPRGQRRRVGANDRMQTTALVNEAYLKLSDHDRAAWSGRGHFLAVAAVAMRQILVYHARHRLRRKRGGGAIQTSLDAAMLAVEADAERMQAVDQELWSQARCRALVTYSRRPSRLRAVEHGPPRRARRAASDGFVVAPCRRVGRGRRGRGGRDRTRRTGGAHLCPSSRPTASGRR